MDTFTLEDSKWFTTVRDYPYEYKIVIDNDCVWVDSIENNECVYTFSTYGYYFIHALLNDIGINVEFC